MIRKALLPLAILAVAAALTYAFIKLRKPPERSPVPPTLVETVIAEVRTVTFTVVSQGTVEPRTDTLLVAEVAGRILQVAPDFVAGGFFAEGDELLVIDPVDYEAEVARAEAEVARRQTLLAQEAARVEQARRDWLRMGSGEASPLTLRLPQLAEAEAEARAAAAALERARRNLERTRIRAPYAGLVREKRADVGQYVAPGSALGRIFAIDYAEVRLPLTKDDLAFLELPPPGAAPGAAALPVRLSARVAGRDMSWPARLVRSEGVFDERNRVAYAVARIEDPYALGGNGREALPVGLFVRAEIAGRTHADVVVLPRQSLRPDGSVLVVVDAQIQVRRPQVIRTDTAWIYLAGGVAAGEEICLTALEFATEGMPVRVLNRRAGE
jgi:RND family efflux transporter MFP subunit